VGKAHDRNIVKKLKRLAILFFFLQPFSSFRKKANKSWCLQGDGARARGVLVILQLCDELTTRVDRQRQQRRGHLTIIVSKGVKSYFFFVVVVVVVIVYNNVAIKIQQLQQSTPFIETVFWGW